MKKFMFISMSALLLTSCSMYEKPLYNLNTYDNTSYLYLKNRDEKSTKSLTDTYVNIIEKKKGKRKEVPPGTYADYGFLLLQNDKTKEGKEMLQKEMKLYPESKPYILNILKTVEK